MLAFWMSREGNATSQKMNGNGTVTGISATTHKNQEFQTPSRRPRFVVGNINFFFFYNASIYTKYLEMSFSWLNYWVNVKKV